MRIVPRNLQPRSVRPRAIRASWRPSRSAPLIPAGLGLTLGYLPPATSGQKRVGEYASILLIVAAVAAEVAVIHLAEVLIVVFSGIAPAFGLFVFIVPRPI